MFSRIVLTVVTTLSLAVPAFAQKRVEVSVLGGWTLADGVSGDTRLGGGLVGGKGAGSERSGDEDCEKALHLKANSLNGRR